MQAAVNGEISFWYADLGGIPAPRPALPGDRTADVCIVGAGYTGLWTAFYLKKASPSLDIVVLEREFAGFGASGRNGGWLTGGFDWSRTKYLEQSDRAGVIAMEQAMAGTVDEIIAVTTAEGIDADIRRNDTLTVAVNAAQMGRLRAEHDEALAWQTPPEKIGLLDAAQTRARINVAGALGGLVWRGSARVQPAKLVRGLADAVTRLGVPIYEQTGVTRLSAGQAVTPHGVVRAPVIIRATEGYTAGLPGHERLLAPVNSAILVTEPLPDAVWDDLNWQGFELLGSAFHAYAYAQRTRGNRIAMGGRGVPYRYGSATDIRGQTQEATIGQLHAMLLRHFPQLRSARIDHAWCGVLGVPRDWCTSVGLDRATGIGWAGGYVGLGVSTSNLAGRTLADLILGEDTDLTRLPWVNRQVSKWEPEPLRWLGIHAMYQLYHAADRSEASGAGQTSALARFANRLTGH